MKSSLNQDFQKVDQIHSKTEGMNFHAGDSSLKELIGILEQANRIASMTSLDDLLSQMLDLMIEISGGTNGTLYLLDEHAGELIFAVVRGNQDDLRLQGRRIKDNLGIVGFSVQIRQPVVIHDLASDPRWYREFHPDLASRLKNAITFPLLVQGKPIGAVQIFNFVRAEMELLQALGNRMASEVDKVMLLDKAKRSNLRLQTLVNILGQIATVLDREELLNLLTENASQLLEAESSSVFLVDDETDEGAHLLSKTYHHPLSSETMSEEAASQSKNEGVLRANSTAAVPLRARQITVGKERKVLKDRIIGNLMAYNKKQGTFDSEDTQLLEILASQASTVLQIATLYSQANGLFLDFIKVLAAAIDAKDPYTRGHSQRVSDISVAIALGLGVKSDLVNDIRIGSLLHDVGKIGVPDQVLGKTAQLTAEEFEQIKKHPGIGHQILYEVDLLHNSLPAIIEHHERLDGSGYPFGLKSEQISLMGRIVAVADVFDALTTDRPYRKAMDRESVVEYLQQRIGNEFDGPCIVALQNWIPD
jgi:HD-GYP domain-containing protein (c-di-GMP phosphodiesterase class II)